MTPVCGHEYFGLIWGCMGWDDEYDNMEVASHRDESMSETGSERRIHPLDIANPASAYFFLSDDALDELTGNAKKWMKCLSCGHRFMGEFYDRCPECFSSDTEEVTDEKTMHIGYKTGALELGTSRWYLTISTS